MEGNHYTVLIISGILILIVIKSIIDDYKVDKEAKHKLKVEKRMEELREQEIKKD